jgi:phage/plasmid-like protein (TIGR03299 family)
MSQESSLWLNQNTLIGFEEKRGTAWHYRKADQGTESNHYPGAIPVSEVNRRLFNWSAVSVPMGLELSEVLGTEYPTWKIAPDYQVICRDDTTALFGVFKAGYQIHQYREWLIDNVSRIASQELQVGSAGLLKGGAQAWVSFEMPDNLVTRSGVEFRPNLVACTSHDGSLATTYKRTTTVVVCDNTLAMALGGDGEVFKIKHSQNSLVRGVQVLDARSALDVIHEDADDFAREVDALTQEHVSQREWSLFLEAYVPMAEAPGRSRTMAENKRESLTRLWNSDERVSPWKNTAWGVLAAANTWFNHEQTFRNSPARAERNMTNALDGTTSKHDDGVLSTLGKVLSLVRN